MVPAYDPKDPLTLNYAVVVRSADPRNPGRSYYHSEVEAESAKRALRRKGWSFVDVQHQPGVGRRLAGQP